MTNTLVSNLTKVQTLDRLYVVEQATNVALYNSVLAGTTLLPAGAIVILKPTSGNSAVRLVDNVPVIWANAKSLSVSSKTQIVALTANAIADATDLATAITLANSLKVTVNAVIAALKA